MSLQNIPGQISGTFDTWTSGSGDAYLAFTIHYVDAPPSNLNDWVMVNKLLALPELDGGHSGANQADVLLRVIDRYNIGPKVSIWAIEAREINLIHSQLGWMTADNATNNDTALHKVAKHVDPSGQWWKAKRCRVR
jgi:hypothetical protein